MTKIKLETFIRKYSLNGILDEVRWSSKNNTLTVSEMTSDKKLMVNVDLNNFTDFNDVEFVIPGTTDLKSKMAFLSEEIKISLIKGEDDNNRIIQVLLEDDRNELKYITGDSDHLQPKPKIMNIPNYDVEIILNERFVGDFMTAKSGFKDVNLFTLIMNPKKNRLGMVLGYSSNMNTIVSALDLDCVENKNTIKSSISFSADILKEILSANLEVKDALLKVSEQGLAYLEFVNDDFKAKYYMIKIPVED